MMDLLDGQLQNILPDLRIRIHSGSGRLLGEIHPTNRSNGFASAATTYQPAIERTLREGLERLPAVEFRSGHEFVDLRQDDDGVTLQVRTDGGQDYELRAQYALACDGGRSNVRSKCGIDMVGTTLKEQWLIVEMQGPESQEAVAQVFGARHRPAIQIQLPRGLQRWEVRLDSEEDTSRYEASDRKAVLAELGRWVPASQLHEILSTRIYRNHARIASRFSHGRVFLVGDAAHIMPPMAGQGLVSGLRDAANLAWKIAYVTQGRAKAAILDSYDIERREHVNKALRASFQMGQMYFPETLTGDFARWALLTAMSRSRFFHTLVERSIIPKPMSPDGLFVGDPPARQLLPQPHVRLADDREQLLDFLLGDAFAAVGFGVDPIADLDEEARAIWRAIGGVGVNVVRPGHTPRSHANGAAIEAVDVSGFFRKWFSSRDNKIAIVRPDRYVAAFTNARRASETVKELGALLGARP